MKKFVGFYYRCSIKVCLWAVLSLIGLTVLSSSAFAQCTQYSPCTYGDFTYMVSNGTVTITEYIGSGGDVVIPSTINGMPVVGIGGYYFRIYPNYYGYYGAFQFCDYVTSVTIPDSVTSIGGSAFFYCTGLTSVTIPDSVTSIASFAFGYCTGLTSVNIGTGLTSIEQPAFGNCTNLTSIVVDVSNPVYSSQDGVVYDKAITTLIQYPGGKFGGFSIPSSVTSIGRFAFYFCSGLTSVNILDSVTSIGFCAFELCSGLTSVTIPGSVTSIGNYAFQDCTSLAKAYFLGNAPSMGGSQVFNNCASNFSICYTAGSTGFTTPTWYGYPAAVCVPPTVINLFSFIATPKAGKVILQWTTASEIDNAGFNIYRSEAEDGEYKKINNALIAAEGSSTQGASYEFIDGALRNRKTYYYKLEDIDLNGTSTLHGPVSATPRLILGIFGK